MNKYPVFKVLAVGCTLAVGFSSLLLHFKLVLVISMIAGWQTGVWCSRVADWFVLKYWNNE